MLILALLAGWVVLFDAGVSGAAPGVGHDITGECCNNGVVNRTFAGTTLAP